MFDVRSRRLAVWGERQANEARESALYPHSLSRSPSLSSQLDELDLTVKWWSLKTNAAALWRTSRLAKNSRSAATRSMVQGCIKKNIAGSSIAPFLLEILSHSRVS